MLEFIKNLFLGKDPQSEDEVLKLCGANRSSKWPGVRDKWIKEHNECAVCGTRKSLQVHHKKPFHLNPALELDPNNFITLCEEEGKNHHLLFGHLGSWSSFNKDVEMDAETWRKKIENRP